VDHLRNWTVVDFRQRSVGENQANGYPVATASAVARTL
jgi:hypothetical protein